MLGLTTCYDSVDAFAADASTPRRIPGGFTRDDHTGETVTSAGHTKAVKSGAARFGALCNGCPHRHRSQLGPFVRAQI